MHKLVIWIEPLEDWARFESDWPSFLRLVESLPGLKREATSRVEQFLYGAAQCRWVHELFFDTLAEAESALASPQGQAAGRRLQQITGGHVSLFLADHKEDHLANILKYRQPGEPGE
jgi:uncharacterized protein (TIGR02118 family)